MKKVLPFLFVLMGTSFIASAQPPKVEAIKVAYITKELSLTSDEAQKFWPVYNEYFGEIKKVREANKSDEIAFEEAVVNIKKKYKPKFKDVLKDDTRVNKVFALEKNFREMLRKEMQKRQKGRGKSQMNAN
ncbi:MAG: hypothetical protein K0Q66_1738 [Chitinophagaceae bacterium]|jgi:hypothetical protein|nr:hypothetical protein [Chitinophagaceae bacterium]